MQRRMRNLVSLSFLVAALSAGQGAAKSLPDIEASLALEKQQYVLGEPIMLVFKARYTGRSGRVELSDSDPYGQCPGYRFPFFRTHPAASRNPGHPANRYFGSTNLTACSAP